MLNIVTLKPLQVFLLFISRVALVPSLQVTFRSFLKEYQKKKARKEAPLFL